MAESSHHPVVLAKINLNHNHNVDNVDDYQPPPTILVVYVRQMQSNDVDASIKCFQDQYDVFDCPATVQAFHHLDPESFLVAYILDDAGSSGPERLIGVCGSPLGMDQTHFIGLYGVHPEYRGLGIGQKLFTKCMERIRRMQTNSGLYAVPEMLMKYIQQAGFHSREHVSMVNLVGQPKWPMDPESDFRLASPARYSNIHVVQVTDDNLEKLLPLIIEYDSTIHNDEPRPRLLKFCLEHPDYETRLIFECIDDHDDHRHLVKGYGCIRQHSLTKRYYLGPLYAESVWMARVLAQELWQPHHRSGHGLVWNAIDANPHSLTMAIEDFGLMEIERCERLFTKHPIRGVQYRSIYAVFSPDFSL